MMGCDLNNNAELITSLDVQVKPTRFLICFDTSSIPKVSFDMATEMSSFVTESCVELFE